MKRMILVFIFLAFVGILSVFADPLKVSTREEIMGASADSILDVSKSAMKSSTLPTAVNVIAGFGIGSFIQGDWLGGIIGALCDAGGTALVTVGATKANGALVRIASDGTISYNTEKSKQKVHEAFPYFASGAGVLLASRIFQMIEPSLYAKRYNESVLEHAVFAALDPKEADAPVPEEEKAGQLPEKKQPDFLSFVKIAEDSE